MSNYEFSDLGRVDCLPDSFWGHVPWWLDELYSVLTVFRFHLFWCIDPVLPFKVVPLSSVWPLLWVYCAWFHCHLGWVLRRLGVLASDWSVSLSF